MTWDLTSYFPEFNGPEMLRFKEALWYEVASLRKQAVALEPLNRKNAAGWEQVLLINEDIARRMSHLSSYISCLASSDARNEGYLKEEAELTRLRAESAKVRIELLRALKPADEKLFIAFLSRSDRKSTRLNSSHQLISYAVFC